MQKILLSNDGSGPPKVFQEVSIQLIATKKAGTEFVAIPWFPGSNDLMSLS